MGNRPNSNESIIDSRDVIRAIRDLEGEIEAEELRLAEEAIEGCERAIAEDGPETESSYRDELSKLTALKEADEGYAGWAAAGSSPVMLDFGDLQDLKDELKLLTDLAEEGDSASSEWNDGAQLIRDSYFVEYAEQLADDIGAIDKNAGWPLAHIDWKAAAEALQSDYTSVEFDGVTYWVRG